MAAIFLAGCGGGGSYGGSGNTGGTGGTGGGATSSDVTVGPATPSAIGANKPLGATMDNVVLRGSLSGNVAGLNNVPVYVVIEDPASLFQSQAVLTVQADGANYGYALNLVGKPLTTSGHFNGNLRIFACLDTQCQRPLGGTPLSVPYDVTVSP
ncbi:hypothetical protein ACFOLJ_11750 [Rugamonas sp. CCM 8940]|uniref:hypothetical protein n=1 Tax=Rugamonas sp. CCM 8940 TaxID=2765359 RepID=UPI0018F5D7DF|nr:hypothetical protein [Rugamonas sp. CCM 8940]MBJ7311586.1 hypothetical protein [Rugamonas sp. CCM 8940]